MMQLKEYIAMTKTGPFLQINEDAIDVDLVNKLFLLLDGFGGSGIGDRAVEKIKQDIKNFYAGSGNDPDATMPFAFSYKYLIEGNALINSVCYAHELIKQDNAPKEMSERAGAGGVIGAMAENIITFLGTGNVLAYLYRDGQLILACPPDNMEGLGRVASQRHFCTSPASGFGIFDKIHFTISEFRVFEGDLFLLFSDGIYSRIHEDELENILQEQSGSHGETAENLMKLANSRGNMDNQSTIFLQF